MVMLRPDFAPLVGVTSFSSFNGVEDNPLLRGWIEAAQNGELVTPAQRNAMVAQLAWSQSILARPPADVLRLVANDGTVIPFPFGVSTDGAVVLGADDYVAGDVVLPPAPRPAGAASATPGGGAAGASEYITNAQRREAFDNATNALAALALQRDQIVLVGGPAPAGWVSAVVSIAVVGVAAYAAYSAYVDAEVARGHLNRLLAERAEAAQVRDQRPILLVDGLGALALRVIEPEQVAQVEEELLGGVQLPRLLARPEAL